MKQSVKALSRSKLLVVLVILISLQWFILHTTILRVFPVDAKLSLQQNSKQFGWLRYFDVNWVLRFFLINFQM